MSSTEILSIVAIVIAAVSGAASWRATVISNRALAWEKARAKPQVTIEFEHAAASSDEPRFIDMGSPPPAPDLFYELTVNVINTGETTEFVRDLYIQQPPNGTGYSPEQDHELKPHSRWAVKTDAAELDDLDAPFRAVVYLANGGRVVSPEEKLMSQFKEYARAR